MQSPVKAQAHPRLTLVRKPEHLWLLAGAVSVLDPLAVPAVSGALGGSSGTSSGIASVRESSTDVEYFVLNLIVLSLRLR